MQLLCRGQQDNVIVDYSYRKIVFVKSHKSDAWLCRWQGSLSIPATLQKNAPVRLRREPSRLLFHAFSKQCTNVGNPKAIQ